MAVAPWAEELVDEAVGRRSRIDPALWCSGGPTGNANLTAWTGLILLILIPIGLVTLINVRGPISWHIVVGTLLLLPAAPPTCTDTRADADAGSNLSSKHQDSLLRSPLGDEPLADLSFTFLSRSWMADRRLLAPIFSSPAGGLLDK